MDDISAIADLALTLGPIAGPAFVMYWMLKDTGGSKRKDVWEELDGKMDGVLDRLARLETKFEERLK